MAKKDRALNGYEEEGWGWYLPDGPEVQGLNSRIADLEAKLAKREAQLVWAFEKCAVSRRHFHLHRIEWLEVPKPSGFRAMQFDGTPAGLLAAIDAATEGE